MGCDPPKSPLPRGTFCRAIVVLWECDRRFGGESATFSCSPLFTKGGLGGDRFFASEILRNIDGDQFFCELNVIVIGMRSFLCGGKGDRAILILKQSNCLRASLRSRKKIKNKFYFWC